VSAQGDARAPVYRSCELVFFAVTLPGTGLHCIRFAHRFGGRMIGSSRSVRGGIVVACVVVALAGARAWSASALDALTQQDAVAGLKAALSQGVGAAVGKLGVVDGFLGNPEVRIPLPGKLEKAKKTLKALGLGPKADELVRTMNRAAEAAIPEARTLLLDAVKQMTVQDAKAILTGGDDAGTQYFRRTTSDNLTAKFLPIIKRSTDRLQVASQYNSLAGQAAKLGLLDARDATVEAYVTQKALDGLFLMMAKEELAIRKDPVGQASKLLQRVFGALKR